MSDSFVTSWTVAHQAPLSMGFSRQEYWSGLPVPSFSRDLPDPGIELMSPSLAGIFFITELPWKPKYFCIPLFLLFFISCITLPTLYFIFEIIFQINYLHPTHCFRLYSGGIQTQKAENVLFVTVFLIVSFVCLFFSQFLVYGSTQWFFYFQIVKIINHKGNKYLRDYLV